jgi:aconitate hydratase
MAPKHLGVRAVFAKSIARIHRRNLIAQGMVPLYIDEAIHARTKLGDSWTIRGLRDQLHRADGKIEVDTGSGVFHARHDLSPREVEVLLAGGLLAYLTGNLAPKPVSP